MTTFLCCIFFHEVTILSLSVGNWQKQEAIDSTLFPPASVIRFICTPLFSAAQLVRPSFILQCTKQFFLSSFSDVANHLNDDTEAEMGSKDD
jgi:hypothetical protein